MAKRRYDTDSALDNQPTRTARKKSRDEQESEELLVLKAEIVRLKNELSDTLETVDIYKQVIADLSNKR